MKREHTSRHVRPAFLITLTLMLAACGRSVQPQTQPTGLQGQQLADCDSLSSADACAVQIRPQPIEDELAGDTTLHSPESALAAFIEAGGVATVPITGAFPEWAKAIMAGDHLDAEQVKLGEPISVRSTIDLTFNEQDAAHDAGISADIQRTLAQVGDAALVPLLLPDGQLGGWIRLPLTPIQAPTPLPGQEAVNVESARARLALLITPARTFTAAQARAQAGAPADAPVIALATAGADYRPFDFTYLVQTAGGTALVSQGQPALVSDDGRLMPTLDAQTLKADEPRSVDLQSALAVAESFALYHTDLEVK